MIVKAFKKVVLKNYANFSGRASVGEYWWYVLANVLINIAIYVLIAIFAASDNEAGTALMGVISMVYSLGVLLPGLAVVVRRLHDTGRGGGWIFIAFVPIIGAIWLLVLLIQNGEVDENRFGDPVDLNDPL